MSVAPRFPFAFAGAYRAPAGVFGTVPRNCWVELRDHEMVARFGLWGLRTPYANIAAVEITGPYAFWKTAGPARLGVTDRGLTFATNGERGVLITFRRPVRSSGPTFPAAPPRADRHGGQRRGPGAGVAHPDRPLSPAWQQASVLRPSRLSRCSTTG